MRSSSSTKLRISPSCFADGRDVARSGRPPSTRPPTAVAPPASSVASSALRRVMFGTSRILYLLGRQGQLGRNTRAAPHEAPRVPLPSRGHGPPARFDEHTGERLDRAHELARRARASGALLGKGKAPRLSELQAPAVALGRGDRDETGRPVPRPPLDLAQPHRAPDRRRR